MKRRILFISGMIACCAVARGQVQLAHDFVHESPDTIGTFQGITFHEGGFSSHCKNPPFSVSGLQSVKESGVFVKYC